MIAFHAALVLAAALPGGVEQASFVPELAFGPSVALVMVQTADLSRVGAPEVGAQVDWRPRPHLGATVRYGFSTAGEEGAIMLRTRYHRLAALGEIAGASGSLGFGVYAGLEVIGVSAVARAELNEGLGATAARAALAWGAEGTKAFGSLALRLDFGGAWRALRRHDLRLGLVLLWRLH